MSGEVNFCEIKNGGGGRIVCGRVGSGGVGFGVGLER